MSQSKSTPNPLVEQQCSFCNSPVMRRVNKTGRYFCNNKCRDNGQRAMIPVSREWLEEMYVNRRIDCVQISKIVNRDPKTIWNWLKRFEIPTRKRGFATASTWLKKGEASAFKGRKHSEETKKRQSEIAIAQGRIPFDIKVGPPFRGKRGAEIPSWKGGVTPHRQAFYSTPEWKLSVKAIWKRDNATCQRCKRRKNEDRNVDFDIHHIVSFACIELRSELSNLVLLCEPCHYWVHGSENVDHLFLKECL